MSNVTGDNAEKQFNKKQIGNIGNTYGALYITRDDDCCFWAIEDCSGFGGQWQEITPELYAALMAFENLHAVEA